MIHPEVFILFSLTVSLCENCYGKSSVTFYLEDQPDLDEISPATAQYSLDLAVVPVNDPPIINAFSSSGISILPNDPTEAILVSTLEFNIT